MDMRPLHRQIASLPRDQTGTDMNELMDGAGDAAEQEMINVTHLLAEAGVGIKDVTKATVFVTDRAYLPGVTDVVLLHPGDAAPRLTTLIIKGLASLDLFMKVDITAVVPGGGS
jgi:enamine deaminase RidA (YjgF/YER057c/UK114 family)